MDTPSGSDPKKRKFSSIPASSQAENTSKVIVTVQNPVDEPTTDKLESPLVDRDYERLATIINPDYVASMRNAEVLRYRRDQASRLPTVRYYDINVAELRSRFKEVISYYLTWKLRSTGAMSAASVTTEVNTVSPVIADACMAALYAKLRTIHKQYGTYSARFNTPPIYNRDIELPTPFADAIQSFGTYAPNGLTTNLIYAPVYPENTRYQGMSTENWHAYTYDTYKEYMREMGITLKSVDTRIKSGTAWWTFKVLHANDHFDLKAIIPASNYSDHAVNVAAMFLAVDKDGNPTQIIKHKDEEPDYPLRATELHYGFSIRAFAALLHADPEEWNMITLIP